MNRKPLQTVGLWAVVDGQEYKPFRASDGKWRLRPSDADTPTSSQTRDSGVAITDWPLATTRVIDSLFRVGYVGRYRSEKLGADPLGDGRTIQLFTTDRALAQRLGLDYSFTFNQFVIDLPIDDPELMLEQVRTPASALWETSG